MYVFARRVSSAVKVGLRSSVAFAALVGAGVAAPSGAAHAIGGDVDLSVGAGIDADVFTNNFFVGDDVLFGFGVTNAGPDVATDVVVTVTLPLQLEIVRWDDVPGASCVVSQREVTCTLATLPVGRVEGTGLLRATEPATGLVVEAVVTTSSNDVDPSDNTSTGFAYNAVTPVADLRLGGAYLQDGVNVGSVQITAGTPTEITLAVSNIGPQSANDVVLSSTIPDVWRIDGIIDTAGLGAGALAPTCTLIGQTVECLASKVLAQNGVLVRLAVTPIGAGQGNVRLSARSASSDPTPDNTLDLPYTIVPVAADLSVSLARRFPTPAVEGEPVDYLATVSNAGPLAAPNARVTLSATPPLTIVSADFRGLPCDVDGGVWTCTLGTVDPGVAQPIRVSVQADQPVDGVSLSATVASDIADPDPTDDTATATLNVVTGSADLRIDVIGPPTSRIVAGEPNVVTVDVVSSGPNIAKGVTVDVDAGPGTSVSSIAGDGWSCQPVAAGARCTRARVDPGFSPAPRITATVVADGTVTTAELGARVSALTADPVTTNDTDGFSVPVLAAGTADLRLSSVASGGDVTVGTPFRVDAIVEQVGPARTAQDVVATFNVPSEYQVVSVQPPNPAWSCAVTTGLVTCSAAERPIFDRSVIVVTLVPVRSGPGGAISVDVVSAGPDPDPSNNSLVFPARNLFETRPDLAVSIAAPPVVEVGSAIQRVEVTVANDAYAAVANGVSVTLTLPEQFEIMAAPLTPCSFTTTTVTCPYSSLNRGSSVTFGVDVLAVAPVANGAFVATATSAAVDADPADNTATSPVTVPVVLPPDAPGTPVGVARDRAVVLSWAPPVVAADVTEFIVEYSADGGRTWVTRPSAVYPDRVALVDGLTNGVRYVFRVTGVNVGGIGTPSPVSAVVTPLAPPRAPTNLRASVSRRVVTLTWRAPDQRGRLPITDYVVEYSRNGGAWVRFDDGVSTLTSATVPGLPAGRYHFRVAAANGDLVGSYSQPSNRVTI